MIWSDVAIDYSAGFTKSEEGTLKPNKIGTYVMTAEESRACLRRRNILWAIFY